MSYIPQTVDTVSCYNSGNQTAFQSGTAVTFDTNTLDTNNLHSTSTNTSRLTCKTAGKYLIIGTLEVGFNTTTAETIYYLRLNGSTLIDVSRNPTAIATAGGSQISTCKFSKIYYLNIGDYVELYGNISDVSAGGTIVGGQYGTNFGMVFLGK